MSRHSSSRGKPRRFTGGKNLRHSVAVEAARLLYTREFKEYFQAKREAARRQACKVLPTNQEIHHHLLLIAEATEGTARTERLQSMRLVALEIMDLLVPFRPRLIGSVWTGHIRAGSDIDLHLYGDDVNAVVKTIESAGLTPTVRSVRSRRDDQEREFLHIGLLHPTGFELEMTLYKESEYQEHPLCSITGGPMARASAEELRGLVLLEAQDLGMVPVGRPNAELQDGLVPILDVDTCVSLLPELRACMGVEQNHFHHTDVFTHTIEVTEELGRMMESRFEVLEDQAEAVLAHLKCPGPGNWDRFSLLILAALCHDIGKPETVCVHKNGRIRFSGHDAVGAQKTRTLAQRLTMPPAAAEALESMVALHMRGLRLPVGNPQPSELYHLFQDGGTLMPELMLLSLADIQSSRGPAQPSYRYEEQVVFCKEMLEEYFERGFLRFPNLPVSAVDLETELGLTDSQLTQRLILRLTEAYVDEEFQGREDGLAWASELLETPYELW